MKLSVLPVSFFKNIISGEMNVGDWAREGVSLGLDAIDISIIFLEKRDTSYLKNFRREIEQEGIQIAIASTYPDFTNPDEEERKRQQQQFHRDIQDLAEVGTRIVRVTAGQAHPGLKIEDGKKWALEGIFGSIEIAQKSGIQLVFENHAKPGVWKYPDFDFPTDIFLSIARELKETPVKILFDCGNPIAYGDNPLPILSKVIDQVICIHASDKEEKGKINPSIIGQGLVPYKQIFSLLKKHSYCGWISIEEASGKGLEGLKKAVEFIKNEWDK